MDSLGLFLKHQRFLERAYADFLGMLDAGRTVTIRQLLEEPKLAAEKLGASWLNTELFGRRIRSALRFLFSIPGHENVPGIDGLSLMFFQSSPIEEDRIEFEERCEDDFGFVARKHRDQGIPPQVLYLHTSSNFCTRLADGHPKRIRPLLMFSSLDIARSPDFGPKLEPGGKIIGHRVPDFPSILGVSRNTATDYFARIVTHDLGHGWLPSVSFASEELHNAVMLLANGADNIFGHPTEIWEQVVHAECTDPFFCLYGEDALADFIEATLNPAQKHYLDKLIEIYSRSGLGPSREEVWGFAEDDGIECRKSGIMAVIDELRKTGFDRYGKY